MPLRAKFSLILALCVVASVFSSAFVQSRFFAADQASYLADLQSTSALQYQKQLELRMRLLHAQLGSLLSSGDYEFGEVVAQVSGAVYGEIWEGDKRLAGSPEERPATRPVPGKGVWSLTNAPVSSGENVLRWIGRYDNGTLVLDLSDEWFADILTSTHGTVARLVDGEGDVLLSSENVEGIEEFDNRQVAAQMAGQQTGLAQTRTYKASDGAEWLASFVPLGTEPPLMIVTATPLAMVTAVIQRTYRHTLFVAGVCLLLAVAMGVVFAGTLTSPLRALVEQTVELAKGNYHRKPAPRRRRNDEVGRLAQAFDEMAGQLDKAKDELRRAERLAAFGKFSSSIAHEIKNPLSSILGNTQVARRALADPAELDRETANQSLEFVEEETRRANRIINRLMKFARQDQKPTAVVDIAERIRRTVAIIRPVVERAGVKFDADVTSESFQAAADGDQIHEVLLNLVQNALHAVARARTKHIAVSLARDGEWMVLRVKDSGYGLSPEAREHLFEPFFTTKPIGQGTGLGLAVCHGIVLNHGGTIDVASEQGKGAEFIIKLPQAPANPAEDEAA